PPERHRAAQRRDQGVGAVRGAQPEQDLQLRAQPRVADRKRGASNTRVREVSTWRIDSSYQ
ncbi:MAG TPA: hypothetical protein VKA66_22555, partial [Mycobacterium sp.]|nr:hypothetical protein [Mycobacterium sp.]